MLAIIGFFAILGLFNVGRAIERESIRRRALTTVNGLELRQSESIRLYDTVWTAEKGIIKITKDK